MQKIHITSFLRPRGIYATKYAEEKQDQLPLEASTVHGDNKIQNTTTTVNCVEIIPTLNFVIKNEAAAAAANQQQFTDDSVDAVLATFGVQHAVATHNSQQHNKAKQFNNIEQYSEVYAHQTDYDIDDDNDDKHSNHTFIISTGEYSSSESLATQAESLSFDAATKQQQTDVSLSAAANEPMSSGSKNMNKDNEKTATSSLSLEQNVAKTSSDNSSIEEVIEEALEASGSAADFTENSEQVVQLKKDDAQLFSIHASELSDDENVEKTKSSDKAAVSLEAGFGIEIEQLSGGKLAQHFVLEDDDDEDEEVEEEEEQAADNKSQHATTSSKSNKQNLSAEKQAEAQESLKSNQSTTNDVSDILEEHQSVSAEASSKSLTSLKSDEHFEPSSSPKQFKIEISKRVNKVELQTINIDQVDATEQRNVENFSGSPENSEKDHSLEEIVANNQSIEMAYDESEAHNAAKMITDLDEVQTNENVLPLITLPSSLQADDAEKEQTNEEDDDNSLKLMKLRILALKHQPLQTSSEHQLSPNEAYETKASMVALLEPTTIRPMERVLVTEFSKEALEDITEESERNSMSVLELQSLSLEQSSEHLQQQAQARQQTHKQEVVVSTDLLQRLEAKIIELQSMLTSKDACLSALNMQLEAAMQRRESVSGAASGEHMGSVRDTSSIVTNSTEYRTLQDDLGVCITQDVYVELSKRDELIAKLTESLQQSMQVREQLQNDSDKLSAEIQHLRKQLAENMESSRRAYWPRDQESIGQRISEISMDLISESDDDLERQFLTDNEEKYSRNSRERQFSAPRQLETNTELNISEFSFNQATFAFNKQIEQFQKYLTPSEARLFFMVQKKFDDFLSQELEKYKIKSEHEHKLVLDQLQQEKLCKDKELLSLQEQRQQMDSQHAKEMEDLRKYFENKCADLEKQYSDDVFSQKSQHHAGESSSECSSDHETMADLICSPKRLVFKGLSREIALGAKCQSAGTSPRKRSRVELLLSPSHRQMTPSNDAFIDDEEAAAGQQENSQSALKELKSFYQNKIRDMQKLHEQNAQKLTDRLHYYESRYPEDEFLHKANLIQNMQEQQQQQVQDTNVGEDTQTQNTSLIIIDQDELKGNDDESQVIQKIIDEYERRLQEQLELARNDIVQELVQSIQNLSDTNVEDQHWPPFLILLREKFTAKSQLEIAQLQIKHEEEMSRLKLEHEKQLKRKNLRNSTFDLARNRSNDQLVAERDNLRELSRTLRSVLSKLLRCVVSYEDDLNVTLIDEVQRVLLTAADHSASDTLTHNLSASFLNCSLNASLAQARRLTPDVQQLQQLVEQPQLVQYIDERSTPPNQSLTHISDVDEFDLQQCLVQLRCEAERLLALSEKAHKEQVITRERQQSESSASSGAEKHDSCTEKDVFPSPLKVQQKYARTQSLNEREREKVAALELHSLPHDLPRYAAGSGTPTVCSSSTDGNASELNLQLHELKNRLVKSETDRLQLQQQLDHTITRNAELGQQLHVLRDQFSQLNSLSASQIDYAQGYGLGSLKATVERLTCANTDKNDDKGSGSLSPTSSFVQLQEKARQLLSITPTSDNNASLVSDGTVKTQQQQKEATPCLEQSANSTLRTSDATVVLLQMIEDFCREGDEVVEFNKKDRDNLQAQIDNADKQLKATRQFLEEQATEREQERDEYLREIEELKQQLRDKEKELSSCRNTSEELELLEQQICELTANLSTTQIKRDQLEVELKASIDKIYVLREIIANLEQQIDEKTAQENLQQEKIKQMEAYIDEQMKANVNLQNEVQSLKREISEVYQQRINMLEEKVQNVRPSSEQSLLLQQVAEQMAEMEHALTEKTKILESLHYAIASSSCSLSVTEDVSVAAACALPAAAISPLDAAKIHADECSPDAQGSPVHPSPRQHSITMEAVQRVTDKLAKHTRVEEAAVKRIRDLEMQAKQVRQLLSDLQQERDVLQDRMQEQTQRISTLQIRLEEQRQRAEELQRTGSSERNIRIHDLNEQVQNLSELLEARDKQIATLKLQMEKSKIAIDRLEAELAVEHQPDRSLVERLEEELKQKDAQLQQLRQRMKTDMINKLSLPDLMETMLADKNEEIDYLKDQLNTLEANLSQVNKSGMPATQKTITPPPPAAEATKLSARTLSDILSLSSEFDEPDVVRRAALPNTATPLLQLPASSNSLDTSKAVIADLTEKRTEDLSEFAVPICQPNTFAHARYFQAAPLQGMQSTESSTPALMPRQINFSAVTEDSKLQTPFALRAEQQALDLERLKQQLKESETREKQLLADIAELRKEVLQATEQKVRTRDQLREELQTLTEVQRNTQQNLQEKEEELKALKQELIDKKEQLLLLNLKEAKIEELQQKIVDLEFKIEELKQQQLKCQQASSDTSSRQFSVDEIARQVEKELNYSAQLDTNILKAIESEEENNLDHKTDDENFEGERDLLNQLAVLRAQLIVERERNEEMRQDFLSVQQRAHEIQEQDASIMEHMRQRLESANEDKEQLMQKLDMQRLQNEQLQTQITAWQRAESRRNSCANKSPTESPRKLQADTKVQEQLQAQLKLLTAQNERERERLEDLQGAFEREKSRHAQELLQRLHYSEKLQEEQSQWLAEKQSMEQNIEHLQQRLLLQTQELEALESRLVSLQQTETRRSQRQERLQRENAQLKTALMQAQTEHESNLLREREREREQQNMPVQFVQELERINALLEWNTRENMKLIEDQRVQRERDSGANMAELEARCQHLFSRYRRVESQRKALVYQKHYLKVSLESYQDKLATLLTAGYEEPTNMNRRNKKKLFKTVALAIIAIKRMKYIVHIWQTGKRTVLKSILTITPQKRATVGLVVQKSSDENSNNNNNKNQPMDINTLCRNNNNVLAYNMSPLQTPALLHDCVAKTTKAPQLLLDCAAMSQNPN